MAAHAASDRATRAAVRPVNRRSRPGNACAGPRRLPASAWRFACHVRPWPSRSCTAARARPAHSHSSARAPAATGPAPQPPARHDLHAAPDTSLHRSPRRRSSPLARSSCERRMPRLRGLSQLSRRTLERRLPPPATSTNCRQRSDGPTAGRP